MPLRSKVSGVALDGLLSRSGALSVPAVLSLARRAARALAALHAAGSIHGEVRPANVILPAPAVFGQAVLALDPHEGADGDLPVESARYASPEQLGLIDRLAAAPSDLYSLGLVLHECLTGRPALPGPRVTDVLRQQIAHEIPDVRRLGVPAPRALVEALARLVRADPDDRYQGAAALLADLDAIDEGVERGERDPDVVIGREDVRGTLAEPSLVGARDALERIDREIAAAVEGRGHLTLIEADSGGGKSRLLGEAAARGLLRGAWIARGQGLGRAAERPLAILSGVARDLVAEIRARPAVGERIRARLGDQREAAAAALPELAAALGTAEDAARGPETMGEERTLRALSTLIDALGAPGAPAIVLLDDAQWADGLAIKLVTRWAREAPEGWRHVALVAAWRADEGPPAQALQAAAAERVVLPPLDAPAVRALVESMAGPVPDRVSSVVASLSGGNPFLAAEVLRGMVEGGAFHLSGGERVVDERALAEIRSSGRAAALLTRRLDVLPAALLDLLSTGAVLGKTVDLEGLSRLSGLDPAGVRAELDAARGRRLVFSQPGDASRYTFVHDRVREALLDRLPPEQLRALHHAAAELLAERGDELSFEVAFHFDAAGEHARALPHALLAAGRARARYALETAERQYRIAARGAGAIGPAERERLFSGLGEALLLQGKYEEARGAFAAALPLAGGVVARARVSGRLAEIAFKQGQVEAAADAYGRALRSLGHAVPRTAVGFVLGLVWQVMVQVLHTLLPHLFVGRRPLPIPEADLLVTRLFTGLTYCLYFRSSVQASWAHLREMNRVERFAPTVELAQIYALHGAAMTALPWISRALRYSDRSLAVCRDLDTLWGRGQALHNRGAVLYVAARYTEAIDASREARALLEQAGDRWEYNDAMVVEALALLRLGDLRHAARAARRTHRMASEIGDAHSAGFGLAIWARAVGGDLPEDLIGAQLGRDGDVMTSSVVREAEALRRLARGRPLDAAEVIGRAWDRVREARFRIEYVSHVPIVLATALRRAAEAAPLWAPARREALLVRAEKAARAGLAQARSFHTNLPWALHEAALLDAIRGRHRRARRRLDRAVAIAARQGARYERARALLSRGRIGEALGWAGAERDLAEARQELSAIGGEFELAERERPADLALVDRFARLLDVGRRIVSSLSKDEILAQVEEGICLLLRAETCAVHEAAPQRDLADSHALDLHLARAAAEGRPVIVPRALLEGAGGPFAGLRSALWAPILTRGRLSAAFVAGHRRVNDLFTADDERVARFVATLAGAALENAEGFERTRQEVRARDEFIQVASHELKTPLTPLRLRLQALRRRLQGGAARDRPERTVEQLEIMDRSLSRLAALIEHMLDASRLAVRPIELARERVDLAALARDAIDRRREALAAAKCEVDFAAEAGVVGSWDPSRLAQVIAELLSNAITYGPGEPIEVRVTRAPGRAVLSVRDHGIGIAGEDQERIFQRFERAAPATHFGGLGLGLYIARQIVEAHEGTLRVTSAPGRGSAFTVELPADDDAPPPAAS